MYTLDIGNHGQTLMTSAKETQKTSLPSQHLLVLQSNTQALQINSQDVDVCQNFSVGDRNKGEFYSPRFPNEYPNNTECIAVITGQFIL